MLELHGCTMEERTGKLSLLMCSGRAHFLSLSQHEYCNVWRVSNDVPVSLISRSPTSLHRSSGQPSDSLTLTFVRITSTGGTKPWMQ